MIVDILSEFPYYSVYFKAFNAQSRTLIASSFPYYSVYFKALIISLTDLMKSKDFHTIQSILKHILMWVLKGV